VKTHAFCAHQAGAERLGLVAGKGPGKPTGYFLATGECADEGIGQWCMLVGAQFTLPGAVATCVGADLPKTGSAAEKVAVAQDENTAVAARHAIEHMHVK
jgi:hypothetical protein